MQNNPQKLIFITASCLGVGCLFGAFAGNLQKYEVWQQSDRGEFGQTYTKTFLLFENQLTQPWGMNKAKAKKTVSQYTDFMTPKILLLSASLASSAIALVIGNRKLPQFEAMEETAQLEHQAQKEYISRQIKQKWALATEAQKQLFRDELRELIALGGDETLEASELNQTDKNINCSYMLAEGHNLDVAVSQTWGVQMGTPEHERYKQDFERWQENE